MSRTINNRIEDLEKSEVPKHTKIVVTIGEKGSDWGTDPDTIYIRLPEEGLEGIETAGPDKLVPIQSLVEAMMEAEKTKAAQDALSKAHQGQKGKHE